MEGAKQGRERPKRFADSQRGYGAEEIASVLDQLAFTYHFYGHTGEAYQNNFADNGITRSVKIKELEFDGQGKLSEGCMLILEVEQQEGAKQFTLSPVPLNEIIHFMRDTWRYCWCKKDGLKTRPFVLSAVFQAACTIQGYLKIHF